MALEPRPDDGLPTASPGRAPLVLRPMLWVGDRLRSTARLVVLAAVLLVIAIVPGSTYADAVRPAHALPSFLGAGCVLWFCAAARWRARRDVALTRAAVQAIAAGDFDPRPLPEGREELADLGRSVEAARRILVEQRRELVDSYASREEQLQIAYEQQRSAERQVRLRAQVIIDQTAASVVGDLRELIGHVETVRRGASAIEQGVSTADSVTRAVMGQAREADLGAEALGHSLRSVSGMTHLIQDVAAQTKLLALNAAIEAARAGAAGRGFNVVAGEVKSLAETTASSTSEITETISTLEQDAGQVGQAITGVGRTIAELDEATSLLRGVAVDQFAVVDRLDAALVSTIERIGTMSTLTERLERRSTERRPVTGSVSFEVDGVTHVADLADLSETGLRCSPPRPLPLPIGREVTVGLTVGAERTRVPAAVVRNRADQVPTDVGLAFVEMDPQVAQVLQRMLAAI